MIRRTLIAIACVISSSAWAADDVPPAKFPVDDYCRYTANCDYEIRERLLSIPVWVFEWTRAQRTQGGTVRFEQRGQKLIAHVDTGMKCEAEVTFVEGGFMCSGCDEASSKKYVQVDDAYQSVFGSYILTLRPPR